MNKRMTLAIAAGASLLTSQSVAGQHEAVQGRIGQDRRLPEDA